MAQKTNQEQTLQKLKHSGRQTKTDVWPNQLQCAWRWNVSKDPAGALWLCSLEVVFFVSSFDDTGDSCQFLLSFCFAGCTVFVNICEDSFSEDQTCNESNVFVKWRECSIDSDCRFCGGMGIMIMRDGEIYTGVGFFVGTGEGEDFFTRTGWGWGKVDRDGVGMGDGFIYRVAVYSWTSLV